MIFFLLGRVFLVMHLPLYVRHQSLPLSSSSIIKSVSSFSVLRVTPKQRRQLHHHNSQPVQSSDLAYTTSYISQQRHSSSNSMIQSSTSLTAESNAINNSGVSNSQRPIFDEKHVHKVLFVECGFGSDAHGQNATKAAVRACRNAIEFNQIPCIGELIPGGRENMKLDVLLGVPVKYQNDLDLNAIRQCFPYGQVHIQCPSEGGGLTASSGKVIAEMGDTNDDMIIVCVAVTVGY